MASKWEVNKAVRESDDLPAPSRLIMFILSDLADVETGVIPDDRTPSLSELAAWSKLDKSTVTRHLNILDWSGWVVRDRPDVKASRNEHVRTTYQIAIGGVLCTTELESVVQGAPSQDGHVGQGMVQSASRGGAQDTTVGGAENTTARGAQRTTSFTPDTNDQEHISSSAKPPKAPKQPKPKPDRPDVERVCAHLADRMVANDCKRPTISQEWRDEARRLIDLDGRTEDQIMRCIDWATAHHFWRKNILSMPTLRKQYDRLRLDAEAERRQPNGRASPALVEHNGLMLGEANIANLERAERIRKLQAAIDAGQTLSIEGRAA